MKSHVIIDKKYKDEINELAKEAVAQQLAEGYMTFIRQAYKLMCMNLNEEFGFGKNRINHLLEAIGDISEIANPKNETHDEEFWYHIDMRLKQIGLDFDDEDYEKIKLRRKAKHQ